MHHKIPVDNMIIYARNGDVKANVWITMPFCIQQVAIQMWLLVCETQTSVGTLFGKDTFDQLGCWHDFPHNICIHKEILYPIGSLKRH